MAATLGQSVICHLLFVFWCIFIILGQCHAQSTSSKGSKALIPEISGTSFQFSNLTIPARLKAGADLNGSVLLSNAGSSAGDEVVEVYLSWLNASLPAPKYKLVWFDRVIVQGHDLLNVTFGVKAEDMALWMDNGWRIVPGVMGLYAGDELPSLTRQSLSAFLFATFTVY